MYTLITPLLRHCRHLIAFALVLPAVAHANLPHAESVPGGVAIVPLASVANTGKPQAWLDDQPVLVAADHDEWYAVVGLSLTTAPGNYSLRINTDSASMVQQFTVGAKEYPAQHITLKDKGKVDLSPANEARAEREIATIRGFEHNWDAAPDNDMEFMVPVKGGELASGFGLRRFFNDEPRAPHVGIDLAVPRGTPVRASAAGTVLATDNYFFNGKTVFIDHGNGLLTMYCHLDKFKVKPGQKVHKGQLIALSGMTGRATGPHLHWSVLLNGTMVDPQLFVDQPITR